MITSQEYNNSQNCSSLIQWNKYFDAIYCVHFLPNTSRLDSITKELYRTGILNSGIFQFKYTYNTIFDSYVWQHIKHGCPATAGGDRVVLVVNLLMAYYNVFQTSLALGHKHVAILEDDIIFDNLPLLKQALDAVPINWDYIHFDKVLNSEFKHRIVYQEVVNDFFYRYTGGHWGSGFIAFSDKAMRRFCKLTEQELWPVDSILENREPDTGLGLNRYVPIHKLCHQYGLDEYYTTKYF